MHSLSNYNLRKHLSFGNDVIASEVYKMTHPGELVAILSNIGERDFLILGGGSNVLFLDHQYSSPIILIQSNGIEVKQSYDDYDLVEFAAGENWHQSVLWSIDQGYGGMENLSLIPGLIGAAPIQNIGAYGVELKDILHCVWAMDLDSKTLICLHNSECEFGYRDSVFKRALKGKVIITSIVLKLSKNNHRLNISYGAITSKLEEKKIKNPTPKDISDVIIEIRKSKLPDPKVLGNGGSFFKNPIINNQHFSEIQHSYSEVPNYPAKGTNVKLPAAWLIDQCGWKGKQIGNVGCHQHQALVIVNYGNATGEEIWNHALKVQDSVFKQFRIKLDPEVNLIK